MLSLGQLKKGLAILHNNEPHLVVSADHHKMGRGGAVARTKLKRLTNGAIVEQTFQGNDKIEEAELSRAKVQYLYADENHANFMDKDYEQFSMPVIDVQESLQYLTEGQEVDVAYFNNKPMRVALPPKVELKVTEAPPAVKGDTANNPSKTVTLETGFKLSVPMFIKQGELIKINTETGEYVERVI
jgi:elongation factor P